MATSDRPPWRVRAHEDAGAVDGAFDTDPLANDEGVHSDAACTLPWIADG